MEMQHVQLSSNSLKLLFIPRYVSYKELDTAFKVVAYKRLSLDGNQYEIYVLKASHAVVINLKNGVAFCEVYFCAEEETNQGQYADFSVGKLPMIAGKPIAKTIGTSSYIFTTWPFPWEEGLSIYGKIRELAKQAEENKAEDRTGIIFQFPQGSDLVMPETVVLFNIMRNLISIETIHTYYPDTIAWSMSRIII